VPFKQLSYTLYPNGRLKVKGRGILDLGKRQVDIKNNKSLMAEKDLENGEN